MIRHFFASVVMTDECGTSANHMLLYVESSLLKG